MVRPCVHFVGFRGDEYGSAVLVWGKPDFIHRFWDRRAQREIADEDTVIFATGEWDQTPRDRNANDLIEGHYPDSRIVEKYASGGLFAVDTSRQISPYSVTLSSMPLLRSQGGFCDSKPSGGFRRWSPDGGDTERRTGS